MLEFYSKEVDIYFNDGLDHFIVWIYPIKEYPADSIVFSNWYKNKNGKQYWKTNIFKIEIDREGITSFCCYDKNTDYAHYYIKLSKNIYTLHNNAPTQPSVITIDKNTDKCYSPDLFYDSDESKITIKDFDQKFSTSQNLLNSYKLHVYYDRLFLKKSKVYINNKHKYTLKYRQKVNNFLLCVSRRQDYLDDIIPVILNFISYV